MADPGDLFGRIRADLAASRRRRMVDLAVERGFLPAARAGEFLDTQGPIEEALAAKGGLPPAQLDELLRAMDSPAAAALDPRESRYEIGDRLGEGAVSVVFRGIDRELGRPVALKFLREGLLSMEKVRERFLREAHSLARMDHPNVVKVHDVGTSGDRLFLVMELIEGRTLTRVLIDEPRASKKAIELLEQAARGVQHAHERGVVHRDLKPDNILVAGAGTAKVADFGLAHLIESGPALTRTGAVLGTPMYMAPEQVHGRGELTARTDVYALGAILYQILTRRTPHDGETVSQIYEKILGEDPVAPRQLHPDLPWELDAVAQKAMDKDPARRYAGAGAFAEELRRWRTGEPVEARPVSTLGRAWRRVSRHRSPILAALLILGVSAAAVAVWNRGQAKVAEVQRATHLLETAKPLLDKAYAATYSKDVPIETLQQSAESARTLIEKALATAPELALSHYRMGEAWEIRGYYEKAGEEFRRATELDARFGPAHYRLGRIRLWQGYLASLNMWTEPDPAERALGERLAREGAAAIEIARAEGSGFDDEIRRDVAAAMIAYLQGKTVALESICAAGIAKYGRREGVEEFHWLWGLVQKQSADRRKAFDEALAIRPKFPLALYARGWTPVGDSAIADYTDAIRSAPGFSEPFIFRGSTLLGRKDYAGAAADFDELIRRGVHLAPAYNGRGHVRLREGRIEEAIADLTEAIRIKPVGYHLPWMLRGEARFLNGDLDGAISDESRALELSKSDTPEGRAKCHLIRGRARAAKGDRAGAADDLKKAGRDGLPYLRALEK